MKSLSLALFALFTSLSSLASAQAAHQHPEATTPPPSEAQKAFTQLKTVEGSWAGPLTTTPPTPEVEGKVAQFWLRVTSRGNALVHEISIPGLPDHPVTMFYLDEDRLLLTHYCDAGNRPRMVGKLSPDGKSVEFDFLDLSGGNQYGHMEHAKFTFIDENRHTEEWTFMMPGDKPVHVRFDLKRAAAGSATPGS